MFWIKQFKSFRAGIFKATNAVLEIVCIQAEDICFSLDTYPFPNDGFSKTAAAMATRLVFFFAFNWFLTSTGLIIINDMIYAFLKHITLSWQFHDQLQGQGGISSIGLF